MKQSGTQHEKNPARRKRVEALQAILGGRPIAVDGERDEPLPTGVVRYVFHLIHLLLVGIRRTHLTRMAAALSYRTMFGLIPVVVMVAIALAAFTSEQTQRGAVRQMLTYAGLDKLQVEVKSASPEGSANPEESGPPTPAGESGVGPTGIKTPADGSIAQTEEERTSEARGNGYTLDAWISDRASAVVTKIKEKTPFDVVGLIALLTLIYAAVSMLVEIEQSFNQIYNAPEGRGWMRRLVQYWTLLTLGPVLLFASFAIQQGFERSAQEQASQIVQNSAVLAWFKTLLGFVSAAAVSTILMLVIYATVPNTRVQPMAALLGAFVSATLWELSKRGFTTYVSFATSSESNTSLGNLYGTIAILPLFLIWIYMSWVIVLFGLQLAYSMQTFRQASARGLTRSVLATLGLIEEPHPAGRPRLIDPAAILVVMTCVAERFRKGQSSDHNHIGEATGVDEQAVGEMLEKLAAAGLLHRVSSGERLTSYALAKPPEQVSAMDVLKIGDELAGPLSGQNRPSSVTQLTGRFRIEAFAGKTLADFVSPEHTGNEPVASAPAMG